jgi:hypothetical protein
MVAIDIDVEEPVVGANLLQLRDGGAGSKYDE